ncbi:MAG: hypothetical protein ACRELD_14995, partial [Longimicrobiales bacterium]
PGLDPRLSLLAAPTWALAGIGYDTLGPELHRERHVLAVPPGENALLTALESWLERRREQIRERLVRSATQ